MSKIEVAGHVAQIVATVFLSLSLIMALLALLEERSVRKERYTFDFARGYYSDELTTARVLVFENMVRIQSLVQPSRLSGSDMGQFLSRELSGEGPENSPLIRPLLMVADYYSSAASCVSSGLCEETLLRDLLQGEASSIICIIGPSLGVLEGWANVSGLDAGLRFFATDNC